MDVGDSCTRMGMQLMPWTVQVKCLKWKHLCYVYFMYTCIYFTTIKTTLKGQTAS